MRAQAAGGSRRVAPRRDATRRPRPGRARRRADGSIALAEPGERVVDRHERLLDLLIAGPAPQAADRRFKRGDRELGHMPVLPGPPCADKPLLNEVLTA